MSATTHSIPATFQNPSGVAQPANLDVDGNLKVNIIAAAGNVVSIADGADIALGSTTDAAVVTDTTGTLSSKLRGLIKWAFERMPASLGQKLVATSFPVVVALDQSALPVTGTFYQATQPVSLATAPSTPVTNTNLDAALSTLATAAKQPTLVSGRMPVDPSGVTSPVSVVSLPLPSGAATAVLQTQPGVDIGDVTINNATGGSAVNVQDGGNSITVDGSVTVTQTTGTNLHAVIDTGSTTAVTQATGSNLHAVLDSGTLTTLTGITNVVHVDDNSGSITVDQPIGSNLHTVVDSGTITTVSTLTTITNVVHVDDNSSSLTVDAVSWPLPTLAATSIKQSDGSQKTQVVDGSGNVIGATSNALDINIKSGNPTTITATQATGTNLHTVVDSGAITETNSAAIKTAVEVIDNFISGSRGLVTEDSAAAIKTAVETIDNFISGARGLVTEDNSAAILTALTTGPITVTGTVSATSAADVLAIDSTAAYTAGDLAKKLIQTPDGRLRVAIAGLVSDTQESYVDGSLRTLSITTEGRLRVATLPAYDDLDIFRNEHDLFFGVPVLAAGQPYADIPNNPWGF